MTLTETSSLEETLNAYIADEYFASLQYRMAKVVAKGKALGYSNNVFGDNGDEEDEHFDEIVEYAQSLNIPVKVNPSEMETNCTTPFVEIRDGDTTAQLVSILISAEKKAIEGYETGLRNDGIIKEHPELIQFFGELLNDERGHLKELEDLESNISADGKMVPQSSNDSDETNDSNEDSDSDDSKNQNDDADEIKSSEKNESIENGRNSPSIEAITRKILLSPDSSVEIVKNLISFSTEDRISDFANYCEYFSPELARETSQYDDNQCKNKFIEMIDDGMLDSEDVLKNLMDFLGEEAVSEFANDIGLIGESSSVKLQFSSTLCESGPSFSEIFKKVRNS